MPLKHFLQGGVKHGESPSSNRRPYDSIGTNNLTLESFACSKSVIETIEKGAKFVQS